VIEQARESAGPWAETPIRARLERLRRFRHLLADRVDELTAVAAAESGKPPVDVINEVFQSCNLIRWLEKSAARVLRGRGVSAWPLVHKRARIEMRPVGVVLAITPWNYPVCLAIGPCVQALAAGNAVILKPSELAGEAAAAIAKLWRETGDDAVWQTALGGPETARGLASGAVDKIVFTGGAEGGKAIMRAAAERLTPVVLELGGSDAAIVAADADLDRAAPGIAWGSFYNAGQSCIAVRRVFAVAPIYDRFCEKLREAVGAIRTSAAAGENGFDIGPVRTDRQVERLREQVADALGKGATLLCGEAAIPSGERRVGPIVLAGVDDSMRVAREECFGPILAVRKVTTEAEAIAAANGTPLGLGASVWSADGSRRRELAARIESGSVAINDCLVQFAAPALPFGGVKGSGFGRQHGEFGLLEFAAPKATIEHRFGPRREMQWFPARGKDRMFRRFLKLLHAGSWGERIKALFGR
ncbi:MAG TPA: aldehyde dehydrogenase family protein, partial [Planctomycetia bacterium]|nr:aldehyde dehydrogenase family protein [Planctomycetia bacterium]